MFINRISNKTQRNCDRPPRQFAIYTLQSFLADACNEDSPSINANLYSMICIDRGYGQVIVDMSKYEIETGTVYYVKPGQVFGLEMEGEADGFVILFQREFFELYDKKTAELINSPLFNYHLQMPAVKIDLEIKGSMKSLAAEMLHAFNSSFDLKMEILKGLLKVFVIYLDRCLNNEHGGAFQSRKMELVSNFFVLLEKNFATKKQVKEYAEILAVTPNYLNDIVKEISGVTAGSHIQRRVILEAKRRAVFEGDTLKEIAYYLGFMDPSHFSKYFKNSSGVNFTDFKKGVADYYLGACQ